MRARVGIWLAAALLVAGCKKDPASGPGGATSAQGVRLVVAYGSEKKSWLEAELQAFRATSPQVDGKPVVVEARAMGSGEAVQAVLRGELKPHVLSPASGAYLTLLNDAWKQQSGRTKALAPPGEALLLSPIVIALWRPMAEALGWPGKRLGWKDLLAVARNPKGWGGLGHPEWGAFKLGHTHPELSNSGLLAVLAAAYAGADKTRGLGVEDVRGKAVKTFIADVERSIVHYGKSTGFFAERMLARGPAYLSAAVLYENLVIESYAKPSAAGLPIVAIYPREGTFWCDHPYSILDAGRVGTGERKAADLLLGFLRARPAQERALSFGFRPADPAVPVGAPIEAAQGADPKQPQTLLDVPDAATLQELLQVWRENKRGADVMLVFDKSGSMKGAPLAEAKRGARAFLDRLAPTDEVTLMFFDGQIYPPFGPVRLGENKDELVRRIDGTFAQGGTALYEAAQTAYETVEKRARQDPARSHAVVLMTDGQDTHSHLVDLPKLKKRVSAEGDQPVRVFTIAYGEDAGLDVLREIAEAAQGTSAKGTLETIVQVYDEMAAFF